MAKNRRNSAGTVGGVVFLLFMVVMGWLIFKAISGVFSLLAFAAPIFLIMALILNHTVVTDYFRKLVRMLKEDTGKGLIYVAGTVIGYPFVAAWLAFKAYAKRSLGSKRNPNTSKKESDDYIKYEEVDDGEDEDFLELPDLEEVKQTRSSSGSANKDNSYDDLFS